MRFSPLDPSFQALCALLQVRPAWLIVELDTAEWQDAEGGGERADVYVGTVMNTTPSGKIYAPWAMSNLARCPACGGKGCVRNPKADDTRYKRAVLRDRQLRTAVDRLGGQGWKTLTGRQRAAARESYRARMATQPHTDCTFCGGIGSREAYLDQLWWEEAEKCANALNLSFGTGEYDGADLFLTQYRETPEVSEDEAG